MKHRIFIGIDLPQSQKDHVTRVQQSLASLKASFLWEPEEKLHLTLNFLSRIEADKLHELLHLLPGWLKSARPFSINFGFLETLYNRHESSLVYLSPVGDIGELKVLQKILTTNLTEFKLSQPERFLPHVTIARVEKTDPITTKKWLDLVPDVPFTPSPSFTIDTIYVYESLLSSAGSFYRKIAHFKL